MEGRPLDYAIFSYMVVGRMDRTDRVSVSYIGLSKMRDMVGGALAAVFHRTRCDWTCTGHADNLIAFVMADCDFVGLCRMGPNHGRLSVYVSMGTWREMRRIKIIHPVT